MKTMLWKELRENFKWALLGFVCLTLGQIYALSTSSRVGDADNNLTLCSATFLMVTSYGCGLVGAALGAVQILPELRRDQWAGLLHRPVSRSVIFFGKAGAGVLLYLLATVVPLALSAGYAMMPGQFAAPFVPGLLVPGLSDIAFGLAFFFAALFFCLYRGSWVARGALVQAMLPLFLLHITSGWPFALPLSCIVIFLVISHAAFLANGSVRDFARVARAVFVFVMLLGCYSALLIVAWGFQFLTAKPDISSISYTNFLITRDNEVLFSESRGDGSNRKLTYPDGKPVTDPRYLGNEAGRNFIQPLPFLWTINKANNVEKYYLQKMPRNVMNYVRTLGSSYDAKETWYYLVDQRYFIGYDKLSRRSAGICDAEGFQPPDSAPRSFPGPLAGSDWNRSSPYLYWIGPQLFSFDFTERSFQKLYTAPTGVIYGAVNTRAYEDKTSLIAVALENEVVILEADGRPKGTLPLRTDASFRMLSVAANPDQTLIYLQYSPDYLETTQPPPDSILDILNLQGQTVQSYRLANRRHDFAPDWISRLRTYTLPPAPALLGAIHQHFRPDNFPIYNPYASLLPSFGIKFSFLPIGLFAFAAILSVVTFFWARRVGFTTPAATSWAILVLGFGLAGLLAFRLASTWPQRIGCPQCRQPRPIEHDTCPHCQKPWPLPEPTGTEVFDQIPTRA